MAFFFEQKGFRSEAQSFENPLPLFCFWLLTFFISILGILDSTGSTVAKFSGETVHQRLAKTEEFKAGKYEEALKRAFLGTDEDLRSSEFQLSPTSSRLSLFPDRKCDLIGCLKESEGLTFQIILGLTFPFPLPLAFRS